LNVDGPVREISQSNGVSIDAEELGTILDGQRRRFLSTFGSFGNERWQEPTRCSSWDSHTVFRHLTDAAELHSCGFTGAKSRFALHERFDPNVTPGKWLALSEDESPEETLERYDRATRTVREHAVAELSQQTDRTGYGPYGKAHWSTITTHVAWDAWLHERDILLNDSNAVPPAGISGDTVERRLIGMYAVLMATVPGVLTRAPLQGTVRLHDGGPLWVRLGGPSGAVEVHESPELTEPDMDGELIDVADSLAGRGQPLTDVLDGPTSLVDSFAALGTILSGSDPVSDIAV
jgi:hypothetical protein